jgi:HEAT repeat protein
VRRVALALAVLATTACGARACSDLDDRTVLREVEVLTGEPGGAADAAERRLLARGGAAIAYLETGLYSAEPAARRRVIRVLVKIGDRAAAPILAHLARRDPDSDVRAAAAAGLAKLAPEEPRATASDPARESPERAATAP